MKLKVKSFLFYGSIFYSIVVVVMMLLTFICSKTTVELVDSTGNIKKINEIKNDVKLLEKNGCSDAIDKLIVEYELTSYDGEVNLKDYYHYYIDGKYSEYILEAKKECGSGSDDIILNSMILEKIMLENEIIYNFFYQYELKLSDNSSRLLTDNGDEFLNAKYNFMKQKELNIISEIIKNVYYSEENVENNYDEEVNVGGE